jgi:hypothetical protein
MPKHVVIEMRRTQSRWQWQMGTTLRVNGPGTGYIAAVETQDHGSVSRVGEMGGRLGTGAAAMAPLIGPLRVKPPLTCWPSVQAQLRSHDGQGLAKIASALCDL